MSADCPTCYRVAIDAAVCPFVVTLMCIHLRLEEAGYGIGLRVIELVGIREKIARRETRIVNMLQVRRDFNLFRVWK